MRRETPEKKRQDEKRLVAEMIAYYCQKKHGSAAGLLCEDCLKLEGYAHTRIARCPFTESKTFCSHCEVHCYAPEMRERIREVMRYSGPHMLIRPAPRGAARTHGHAKQKGRQEGGKR